MLFVYARHTPDCDHRDDPKYRRCRCPKWIDGYVDNQRLRQSAKTRSWEKAELTARSIQEAADPMKAESDPAAREKARTAYQNFLTLWKDADPDVPIYRQAKAEYAKLQ